MHNEIINLEHKNAGVDLREVRKEYNKTLEMRKPYMDKHFMGEIQNGVSKFQQRYFEAYLGRYLIENEISIKEKKGKKGPDFHLCDNTYIECVAPSSGEGNDKIPIKHVNRIGDEKFKVNIVPEEKILLRLANAFTEKHKKFNSYVNEAIIKEGVHVIAINGCLLNYHMNDRGDIPWIVNVLFGSNILAIEPCNRTSKLLFKRKTHINKENNSKVNIGYFNIEEYNKISAVIYTTAGVFSLGGKKVGCDFVLIKNPYALYLLDKEFDKLPFAKIYELEKAVGEIIIAKNCSGKKTNSWDFLREERDGN